jgi:trigger factor
MKIRIDKKENLMVFFTIEVEVVEMEKYFEKAYQQLLKENSIPGYAMGQAPRDILEGHLGEEKMLGEAIKNIVPEAHSQAVREYKLETHIQPSVRILEKTPLVLQMLIPLDPVVELCDYRSLKIEPEPLTIEDDDINKIIDGLREQFASYRITNDPAQEYDMVNIDIEGTVNGSLFLKSQGLLYSGSDFLSEIIGIHEKVIGMKKGEEKVFELQLPENYGVQELAGKEAAFRINVNDIKKRVLLELNDEFAKLIDPTIESFEALKDRIKKNMQKDWEENAKMMFETKLMDTIVRMSRIEYPSILVDREVQTLIKFYNQEIQMLAKESTTYRRKSQQLTQYQLLTRCRSIAEDKILGEIILDEVAKAENIAVTREEVEYEIAILINELEGKSEGQQLDFSNSQNRQNVYDILKTRKTLKRLTEIVNRNNSLN